MAYQYFDANGNEAGDEGSFQSTTAEFPESFSISPLDADLVIMIILGIQLTIFRSKSPSK